MKFSKIEFTENDIDEIVCKATKKASIGCIQLKVEKRYKFRQISDFTKSKALSTSALKVWEQDKKLSGRVSIATWYTLLI